MLCGLTHGNASGTVCVCAKIFLRVLVFLFGCFHWAAFLRFRAATCLCLILGFFSLVFLARLAASMYRVGSPTP